MESLKELRNMLKIGRTVTNDPVTKKVIKDNLAELNKKPLRSDIINELIKNINRESSYLEIGVRNPNDNFKKIHASKKISVDPGMEYMENPVDFKMTSDQFFSNVREGKILNKQIKFDVVFIDGLHKAEQVDRDIINSLEFLSDDGFIVLHDCNPPSEYHARENFYFKLSPAGGAWNGTTWKAFYKFRQKDFLTSCCIDTDYGVGILTKRNIFTRLATNSNPFYDYEILNNHRKEHLGLMSFEELTKKLI
jgi:hypothetical protein